MSRIVIALASIMVVSPPAVMGKEVLSKPEPFVNIVTVTERDLTFDDAPPRTLKMLDSTEYNAVVNLVEKKGHATGSNNDRAYIYIDSLHFAHDVIVTFKPDDLPWDDRHVRPMQVDVFASGPASFAYALSEKGSLIFDCRCPSSTPVEVRTKYDNIIKSAVDSMVRLGKKK